MPKEVYINKSVLKSNIALSAFGNSGKNYSGAVQSGTVDYVNNSSSCLAFPCVETVYINKPITFSNADSVRGTNITDVSILLTTSTSVDGKLFTESTFYKNRDKFSLVFYFISSFKASYNNTLYTYSDSNSPKVQVTIPANTIITGTDVTYKINSTSLFGKLIGEMHSANIYNAPDKDIWYILESLSLNPNTISIEAKTEGALNTALAAEILADIKRYISAPKLQYTQSRPDWSGAGQWKKEFSLPESTKAGARLFLKDIVFTYPKQFPVYTHKPAEGYEYRFLYQAPIASRSVPATRELDFSYYSPASPARILSDFTDTLDSSSDDDFSAVYVYWSAGYREVLTADSKLSYRDYVHQAFYDSCIFEFTLSDNSVKTISLLELFKYGLELPAGITSVKLSALLLPNTEGFVLNNYFVNNSQLINNLEPQHFYSAISAFSRVNVDLNIGYQSASEGIFIDTTKIRKLYIDEAEVESFIADN
jgi:hypothetical protein